MIIKFKNNFLNLSEEFSAYALGLVFRSPETKFCIFGQGRTGSTLLCNLLESHPKIHADREILFKPKIFPNAYVKAKAKKSSVLRGNGVYGFKVKIYQLLYKQNLEPKIFLKGLVQDNWKLIYLKRDNYLRHAISNQVAKQRNQFHVYENKNNQELMIKINCSKLISAMESRESFQQQEECLLENLNYQQVIYEHDLLDSSKHQITADRIFQFLGLDSYPVRTNIIKSTEKRLSDFIENISEVYYTVAKSKYAYLLEQETEFI